MLVPGNRLRFAFIHKPPVLSWHIPLTSFLSSSFSREHTALSPLELRSARSRCPPTVSWADPPPPPPDPHYRHRIRSSRPSTPLDDAQFVFATTVFVLGCFALFAVLTWPRLLTRFSRGSEWTRGHFIYHSTKPLRRLPSLKRRPTISRPLESRHEKGRVPNSEDNHTTFSHVGLVRREGTRTGKSPSRLIAGLGRVFTRKPPPSWGSSWKRAFLLVDASSYFLTPLSFFSRRCTSPILSATTCAQVTWPLHRSQSSLRLLRRTGSLEGSYRWVTKR
jgi:hypothetical protein